MTRRKDGLWQEKITINGKAKYFYGRTKTEVLHKIREYQEIAERGKLFKEVAEDWWEIHEEKVAYNTAKSYKPAKDRAVEALGDNPIKDILPVHISREIKAFARKYADKTVRTQLMVYNHIFSYAVEQGYILFNPVRDLKVPDGLPKKKVSAPPQEEIEKVKASTDSTFGMFAYWAMYTGMRRGELLALEWSDVDIKRRRIKITKSLYHENNKPVVKEPKTKKSIGEVPILDTLMAKIKPQKSGLVFPNENYQHLTETQFQRQWELYCKETGITSTPHQFRHAYATMLFEAGIPPEEMQILLRHAQLSTTMDIYTDIREQKKTMVYDKVYSIDI